MTQSELLKELEKLTAEERLEVIEAAIHLLREDFQQTTERSPSQSERKQQLAAAAEVLLPDYTGNDDLTGFTALDSEGITIIFQEKGRP